MEIVLVINFGLIFMKLVFFVNYDCLVEEMFRYSV